MTCFRDQAAALNFRHITSNMFEGIRLRHEPVQLVALTGAQRMLQHGKTQIQLCREAMHRLRCPRSQIALQHGAQLGKQDAPPA
jgi:hypothetical protein